MILVWASGADQLIREVTVHLRTVTDIYWFITSAQVHRKWLGGGESGRLRFTSDVYGPRVSQLPISSLPCGACRITTATKASGLGRIRAIDF